MDEMKKAIFDVQIDLQIAAATAELLTDHFNESYSPKGNTVSMPLNRFEMCGNVLVSICSQLRQITKDLEAIGS